MIMMMMMTMMTIYTSLFTTKAGHKKTQKGEGKATQLKYDKKTMRMMTMVTMMT